MYFWWCVTKIQKLEDQLELSEPRVGDDGAEDRGQVAESHKGVVDGGGKVIVPSQEVLEVQHKHSCTQ